MGKLVGPVLVNAELLFADPELPVLVRGPVPPLVERPDLEYGDVLPALPFVVDEHAHELGQVGRVVRQIRIHLADQGRQ